MSEQPAVSASGPVLACRNVHKTFYQGREPVPVLLGVDLEVAPGERVAIVGASGVGKSTLLHVLGGLDRVDSGSVTIGGTNLSALPDGDVVAFRNAHVGFVFQFHHLLPEFNALENVEMPMRIARMPSAAGCSP